MLNGAVFNGRKGDNTSYPEALGMLSKGESTQEDVDMMTDIICPTCGSCSFLGTANSMCCFAETLGMTLPGSSMIPTVYNDRKRDCFATGETIVDREGVAKLPGKVKVTAPISADLANFENLVVLAVDTNGNVAKINATVENGAVVQLFHCFLTAKDVCRLDQRLFNPVADHAFSHGGARVIQHAKQRSAFALGTHRFGQFQISPRRQIQAHILCVKIDFGRVDALEPRHLG